jgi:CRP-like cAMP-binding protein
MRTLMSSKNSKILEDYIGDENYNDSYNNNDKSSQKQRISTENFLHQMKTIKTIKNRKSSSIKNKMNWSNKAVDSLSIKFKSSSLSQMSTKNVLGSSKYLKPYKNDYDGYSEDMIVDKIFSEEEMQKLREVFINHYLFKDFNLEYINILISDLIEFSVEKGRIIFEENSEGKYFYIIKNGILELNSEKENFRKNLTQWDSIGEISLLQKSKRNATLTAITDSELFLLEGSLYREIKKNITLLKTQDILAKLEKITIFKNLLSVHKNCISNSIETKTYLDGDAIVTSGEEGNAMYIIKKGIVKCTHKNGKIIKKLKENECFGENSLLLASKRYLSVISEGETILYMITKKMLKDVFGSSYKEYLYISALKDAINKKDESFPLKSIIDLDKFIQFFSIKMVKKNELIYSINDPKKIIFVVEGDILSVKYI